MTTVERLHVDTPQRTAIEELKTRPQWVCYRLEKRKEKITKVPYNARTGKHASITDPQTWSSYDTAKSASKQYDGYGFVFSKDDPYTGIDLDHCVHPDTREIDAWAKNEIQTQNSYSEYSQSRTGVHIIVRGLMPESADKNGEIVRPGMKCSVENNSDAAIEMYSERRFFVVTENHVPGTPTTIEHRQREIDALQARYARKPQPTPTRTPLHATSSVSTSQTLSDDALIEKACQSNPQFARLWHGDISDFANDQSNADQSLCERLAWWTGKDAARMDRLFRRSGLMREKWDRNARSGETYGEGTIQRGIERCTGEYSPNYTIEKSKRQVEDIPRIILGEQDRITRGEALDALAKKNSREPTLFVQLSKIVKVVKDECGNPVISPLGIAAMKNELSDAADFFKMKKIPNTDDVKLIPVPEVPQHIAESILALAPSEWPFKKLHSIVETPVLRPDGTILDTPGYDEATQLYYAPAKGMEHVHVPFHPTQAEIKQAVSLLQKMFFDFPFETEADRANAIGLLITPCIRHIIKGDVQIALLNATKAGTGKGYISHIVSIVATGKRASVIPYPTSDEELDKRISAKLMAGATIMILDNIPGRLQSSTLEAVLTCGGEYDGRILGQSKMVKVSSRATWIATGNNLQIAGDLYRRCYQIRMIPTTSSPEERNEETFQIPAILEWTEEHRSDVIASILTIARAWFIAGKPKSKKVPSLASFTEWAKIVGGILEYAGIEGFQTNRAELKAEADVEEGQWEAFLLEWERLFDSKWITTKDLETKIKEVSDTLADSPDQLSANLIAETLPDSLKNALKEKPQTFTMKLAKSLEKRIKTPYGVSNIRIEADKDKHTKGRIWRVMRIVADSHSSPSRSENNSPSPVSTDKYTGETGETTIRNYPQLETNTNDHNESNDSTGHSTRLSSIVMPQKFADSPDQLSANRLHQLKKKLSQQSNIMYNGDFLPLSVYIATLDQALHSNNEAIRVEALAEIEKRLA